MLVLQPSSDGDAAAVYSPDGSECYGRIHISSLLTGRCIARVVAPSAPTTAEERATHAALTSTLHGTLCHGTLCRLFIHPSPV
jgi:hypothetical protein